MFEILASGHHSNSEDLTDIPLRLADLLFNQASLLEIVLVGMLIALAYYIHIEGKDAKKRTISKSRKSLNH